MGGFLRRLFGRRAPEPEPGSIVEELWEARLDGPRRGRFRPVEEGAYRAAYVDGKREQAGGGRSDAEPGLELSLGRADLFAWTEAPPYRYSDCVLEGELEFAGGNPYSACGFLFRYQDESNFYSALVSSRGYFRLDAVFNGSPRALIAWTELPELEEAGAGGAGAGGADGEGGAGRRLLTVISRGGHFTILVDGEWAGEAVDDTFRSGYVAFAGQNYGEADAARFRLRSLVVDSRPVEVEARYYRENYYLVPADAARLGLARTFLAMGEWLPAAVQLRKLERRGEMGAEALFLKAEAALRLGLRDEAAEALDACLRLEPSRPDALEERANLLYLRGRFLELRDAVEELKAAGKTSPRLLGLSGHARFSLGDFEGAAAEYAAAAALEPEQPILRMNEARAWDQAGKKGEAAEAYLAAARLFWAQEADDDLALALNRLQKLRPRSPELAEIKAKALFRGGKKAEAAKLMATIVERGSADSALHYLYGLILSERGESDRALGRFEEALRLEPEYPLYAFRYAERLFLSGRDSSAAIARAVELAPAEGETRGWIMNLAGQEALGRGDLAAARGFLEAARAALSSSPDIAVNFSELSSREGDTEAALAALEAFPESSACRNQAGNVLAAAAEAARGTAGAPDGAADAESTAREKADELVERASREYLRATILDPADPEYQANLAAAYLELERYSEAEERIRKSLDLGSTPRALLLAGNLAMVYGDLPRAEAAYRLGLDSAPGDGALSAGLARCYLAMRKVPKAEALARSLRSSDPERAARLLAEIEDATTEGLSCASCGRAWRLPRLLPPQSGASIRAMPPDDSPAGACPECGKVFCIACRKGELVDSRFTCPDCGSALKLTDDRLRWLVRKSLRGDGAREPH